MIKRLLRFLFICLLFASYCTANAQDVTGSWKGYLVESDFRQYEQRYNIEIAFEQLQNGLVKSIITVYKKKAFQSRTAGIGILNKKSNSLVFSEIKILQKADSSNAETCFMAFQLFYSKMGNEVLTGIFRTRKDAVNYCSEGKVYLRKFIPLEVKKKIREERKEKRALKKQRKKMIRALK